KVVIRGYLPITVLLFLYDGFDRSGDGHLEFLHAAIFHRRSPRSGTTLPPLAARVTTSPTRVVASRRAPSTRWAYRAVVAGCEWPSNAPMTGSEAPPLASVLAKLWRRSWTRRPLMWAARQMACQGLA